MPDKKFIPYGVIQKPIEKGFEDKLIEYGIKKYVDYKKSKNEPLATNQQVFVDTFINNKKEPLTEKAFKPEELDYLRNLLKSQIKARIDDFSGIEQQIYKDQVKLSNLPKKELSPGALESVSSAANAFKEYRKTGVVNPTLYNIINGKTDYYQSQIVNDYVNQTYTPKEEDYYKYSKPLRLGISDYAKYSNSKSDWDIDSDISSQRNLTEHTPTSIIHTTLGRFNASFDPTTQQFNIKEAYDFGSRNQFTGQPIQPLGDTQSAESGGNMAYNIIRGYAGRMQPEGEVTPRQWDINFKY